MDVDILFILIRQKAQPQQGDEHDGNPNNMLQATLSCNIGEQCNNEKKVNDRSFCISWAVVGVGRHLFFSSVKRFRIWSVRNFSFIVYVAPYKYKTYIRLYDQLFRWTHIFKIS
jgi:hypothetical protein